MHFKHINQNSKITINLLKTKVLVVISILKKIIKIEKKNYYRFLIKKSIENFYRINFFLNDF